MGGLDTPITNWKLRCEIYDSCGQGIRKATANTGGSDTQILITDDVNGKFSIFIDAGETTSMETKSFIEIEGETPEGKIFTINQGQIVFLVEKIKWDTP